MFPTVSQLDSFTDVFGDADQDLTENSSQPLSLSTTSDTPPDSITNGVNTNGVEAVRPAKNTGQKGEFRSVEEIDPKYRCLFTYPYFNLVQSRIIEDALYSDKSLVVCAPTGSGKTVVFELAILQLLMQMEDEQSTGDFKIIYMAPVKALCNERLTEWYPKLTKLGLLCIEVTGDTEVDFSQLSPYRVIITTPEKWDMLTRRWRDHRSLVEMIKLFLIDEVHILNDETRGPVLEAVVSRMKTVESAAQSAHRIEQLQLQYQGTETTMRAPPRIRFVAVSATVSNPEDVAAWLGTNEKPAVFHKFGDETRPVKLQRIVEGYPCAEGTNTFKFDLILNYKLWPIIQKYYNGKPTLIFCNTRKSVALTAEALSREVTVRFSPEQTAKLSALASTLKNKKLQMLVMSGVGCHHAGLLYEERINIERAFRNMELPILITTTTLAMGVNLPAHLVIVKNTQQYVNGAYQEYSISTVLQMVGRAGRPQFDTEATAVIMTRLQDKPRYQALVGGCEPLQSYLHKRLAENLNSEAALGTVTDVAQCVEWLRSTFLYVRAAKDPRRYLGLPPAAPQQLILKKIEELCVKAMNSLASSGLITMDEASCIESTEAGRLMSMFYMDVETMKNIMKIEGSETLERLLWLVCESHELSDMYLRVDERRCLNLLNRNNKAATIRFPMKGKISTRQMKLNCIIQATLGCLHIPEPALNQEAIKIMRTASRVCKCLVKYVTRPELPPLPQTFSAVLNSIILSKCIEAHLWENSPYVSKQLKGIGPTFSTLLASAGITSFMLLEESHPRDLERIMNKGPPAGNVIRKQVSLLPKYQLTVTPIDARSVSIQLMLLNHAYLSENMDQLTAGDGHRSYLVVGDSENHLLLLTRFTDKDFISIYDGTMKYEVTRNLSSEHKILIHCVSSTIVGIDVQADHLFLDLEPQSPRESEHFLWSASNEPKQNVTTKQTAITDVYRERKRKNDNDITQCKEKKKREYTMTQKLMALKESFSKTSKTLKTDVDKSVEMSKKLIHDILESKHRSRFPDTNQVINKVTVEGPTVDLTKGNINNLHDKTTFAENRSQTQQVEVECPTIDLTENVITDTLEEVIINDDDDYIDDSQIDSILSRIESEISENSTVTNNMQSNNAPETAIAIIPNVRSNARSIPEDKKVESTYKYINNTQHVANKSSRRVKDITKRKNLKSNYSFLDLIEKKSNTTDVVVEKNVDKSVDSGFSDAIKSQINKFLQRAQNTTKRTTPVIDELLDDSIREELPEVFVKNDQPTETNTDININGQDNINSESANDRVQCDETESLITMQVTVRDKQCLNDENCDISDNFDLPEVNLNNTSTVIKSNKYEDNHKIDNNVTKIVKETEEYDKLYMDMCENLRENNTPEENKDYGGINPTVQLNSVLTLNQITDNKDMSENIAAISHITRDESVTVHKLETVGVNEQKENNIDLAIGYGNPTPTVELNHHTETPENNASIVLIKSDRKTTTNSKVDTRENNTIDEKESFGENRHIMPQNANIARNPVTRDQDSLVKFVRNSYDFALNKNLPAQTMQTITNPNAKNLELEKECEKILATLESNLYGKRQVHSNNVSVNQIEKNIMKSNQMDLYRPQEVHKPGHSIQYNQTAPLNLISTSNTFILPNESLEKVSNNSSNITWDTNLPVKSLETIPTPTVCDNTLVPYHKAQTIRESHSQQPSKLHSYIRYSDRQNVFGQDTFNEKLVDKMMTAYPNKHQTGPSNYNTNYTNPFLTKQMRAVQPSKILKILGNNENLVRNINQPDNFLNPVDQNVDHPNKELVVKHDKHEYSNNQNETYFKRFSYTATKVDVCTKKYAPDHELRITRKLKVDLDVTEIVKQDNTNRNEGQNADTNKEHDDMRPKQNNEIPHQSGKATPKLIIPRQDTINTTIEGYTGNTYEQYDDTKLQPNNKSSRLCEKSAPKSYTADKDIVVNNNHNQMEKIDARKSALEAIADKPQYLTANNSIGNILQRYSKILVKPETTTSAVNKINKRADTASIKSNNHSVSKSRKPFKISQINAIDVELPLSNLTNTNKPTHDSPIESIPTAKRIKTGNKENLESYATNIEPMHINATPKIEHLELCEPNTNMTPKTNRSFESPVSVHSFKLDSIEDIKYETFNPKDMKDENMFNPKLLLQYFTEGNETSEIIAPPPDFCDNAPVYSPRASQETKEYYNVDSDNIEDNFNTCPADCLQSPKEMVTWCLSKHEEDKYESPVRSAPWVISQRAHTNLGARRAKLCQFKFVRKKTFRP